jgi:hypothetical protein
VEDQQGLAPEGTCPDPVQSVRRASRAWLVRACHQVPCFKLVVERLLLRPSSGMERYLVKIAMAMQPALYVPTEKPPPQRLYVITDGEAYYKGVKLVKGDSWGAEDVLLTTSYLKGAHRATAATYLHVLWVGASTFDALAKDHREGLMLTRLWANVFAAGNAILADYRRHKNDGSQIKIGWGGGKGKISPKLVEQKINNGQIAVEPLRGDDGMKRFSTDGYPLYDFKHNAIELKGWEIVKVKKQFGEGHGRNLHVAESYALRERAVDRLMTGGEPMPQFFAIAQTAAAQANAGAPAVAEIKARNALGGVPAAAPPAGEAAAATTKASATAQSPSPTKAKATVPEALLGVMSSSWGAEAGSSAPALSAEVRRELTDLKAMIEQHRAAQSSFIGDMREEIRQQGEAAKTLAKEFSSLSAWVVGDVFDKLQA